MERHIFTSESVTEGHPDKMCDKISDSILDAIIDRDPMARVACETATTTGLVLVMGEITTDCYVDIPRIVRDTVRDIGYTRAKYGFDYETCAVLTAINEQSGDIAMGVNNALDDNTQQGAGDQGMMFGFACRETKDLMPYPITAAHALSKRLAEVRKEGILDYLRPDGKSQVSVEYIDGRPVRIDTIVIAAQHAEGISIEDLREDIKREVIGKTLDPLMMDSNTKIFINATGKFVTGGPAGDSGLTGRKIIVDTYGGMGRHGGGAFSGKDPTKVDRSGAYAARWVAKNIVASGAADKCEIQLAYAIGVSEPVSINVDTFGTGKAGDASIIRAVRDIFELKPGSIIKRLELRKPVYSQVAAYGHFGRRELDLSWEKTDMADKLAKLL
ncbi:MAG: methionine adenosyltransferase [Clostridia bacterium]|nr:methionine adenosyltransferase [Clostridia bacterium]